MSNSSRRTFLKIVLSSAGLSASGLCFSDNISQAKASPDAEFKLFTIHPDNSITVYNSRSEMGQGVMTSLSQLILEDLDADWAQIKTVLNGWADEARFGHQNTIGAISSFIAWESHRQAGAAVNLLLRETAADIWQLDLAQVKTRKGKIYCIDNTKTLNYGDLCSLLQGKELSKEIELKPASEFTLIGKSVPRVDIPAKVEGLTQFGIDQQLPNMKVATLARCPVFGGSLRSFNDRAAKKIKGVSAIFAIPSGVAVVADNYWQSQKALRLLDIQWDFGEFVNVSSESLMQLFAEQLKTDGNKLTDVGNAEAELSGKNTIVREFEFPLVAHMTMEPMNCTVWHKGDSCEIWAPTQNPQDAQTAASQTLKLDKSKVRVNTTFMGGGFGRRSQEDFVVEACEVAQKLDHPIKVVWSREDDVQHDFYRPLNRQRISASLKGGKIHAWQHKVATLATSPFHFSLQQRGTDDGDWVAYGGSENSLYQIPNFQTQVHLHKTPMSVGILRGISHGYVNFAAEITIEALAQSAGIDPIEFRLAHVEEERARIVLQSLKDKISELKIANNQFIGIAFGNEKADEKYQYFNAAAAIVEKSNQTIKIKKILLVLDHGQVIHPDNIRAQAEGSVIFALSMMFKNSIQVHQGQIQQSNFHDYAVTRMGEEVDIDVHTIDNHYWPMGTGEKLQGSIQPAIANALSRASGKAIHSIPINLSTLVS